MNCILSFKLTQLCSWDEMKWKEDEESNEFIIHRILYKSKYIKWGNRIEIMYDLILYSKVLIPCLLLFSTPVNLEINRDLMILSLNFDLIWGIFFLNSLSDYSLWDEFDILNLLYIGNWYFKNFFLWGWLHCKKTVVDYCIREWEQFFISIV